MKTIKNPTHVFYKASNNDAVTTFEWNIEDPRTRKKSLVKVSYFVAEDENPDGGHNAIRATHRNSDWIGGKLNK